MSLGLGVAVQRISKALSRALRGLFSVGGKDPKLVFDFNNEYYRTNGGQKSFSNAMTFSRASSATMVDSTGTLITVPSGTPRIGHHVYNGDQWVNKGILVESEARTNVVTYSDQFNNAAWTKAAPTITADAIASPDGNDNADKLIESSTTAHAVYQVPTVTAVAYTFSVFAKSAERTQVNLDFTGGTNGAYFNLSTGEVISSSGTGLTAAITPMGNDWYRCSITQVQSAGAIYPSVSTSVGGARVYLGDGSSGIYIYGAQLEAGSTPSSYIPTSGSTVTRAAETVTVPYANLPWPTPTYIGDELVTDGEFSSTANWVEGNAAWSVTGGALVGTAVPNNQYIGQPVIAISSGTILYVTVSVSSYTSGGLNFTLRDAEVGTNEIPANLGVNGTGTFTTTLVATQTNMWLEVLSIGTTTMTIDNISVREINPLSVSIAMMGEMDYVDEGFFNDLEHVRWLNPSTGDFIRLRIDGAFGTGNFSAVQKVGGVEDSASTSSNFYTDGLAIPYNFASRNGSNFVNGAVDGTALTADTTPVALPDLSTTNLLLAYNYMGTISEFRMWDRDIGDTGIAEATA